MIIEDIPDEDLIREFQRRVDKGHTSWARALPAVQIQYRDMWWTFCSWLSDQRNKNHDEFLRLEDVQRQVNAIADGASVTTPEYVAINTTFIGQDEIYTDHSPKAV